MNSLVYLGVMNSIGKAENGFTRAMKTIGNYREVSTLSEIDHCDYLFIQIQDTGLNIGELQRLKSQGTFIVSWTGDARHITPKYCFEYAPHIDLSAFSNMQDVETMQDRGFKSSFLQIGYDPAIYHADNRPKDIDITFMGNSYGSFPLSGYRQEMVSFLKYHYRDRFKAFGIGQPDGNLMHSQHEEAEVYRRSKIAINLSHFNYDRYTSDRLFRALGSGCLVLSHEYPGIYEDFNPHDMGIWRNFDELKSLLNHYLGNEAARQKIANNGYQKALERFTFESMAKDIVQLWKDHR